MADRERDPLKDHVVFVITDRDIVDLDTDEFAALWLQLGRIARTRGAHASQAKSDG